MEQEIRAHAELLSRVVGERIAEVADITEAVGITDSRKPPCGAHIHRVRIVAEQGKLRLALTNVIKRRPVNVRAISLRFGQKIAKAVAPSPSRRTPHAPRARH